MSKPRVLIIENATHVTGGLKSILRSTASLNEWFDFDFVLPTEATIAASMINSRQYSVHYLPLTEIRRSWWSVLVYVPMLLYNAVLLGRLVAKGKIQLIVGNDFYNLLPPVYRLLGGRVPYVTFVRFMPDRFPRWLVWFWCALHIRFARALIAVSHSVQRKLRLHQKIMMIHNEVPLADEMVAHPYSEASRILLYVSNTIPGKGLEYAIQALAALGPSHQEWLLRFVGGDMGLEKNRKYKEALHLLAKQLGVEHRVQWAGFTHDVSAEFSRAALVLNFSESESFSLTCVEAMYCGRPVLATRCGGPEEIITHGVDGELVEVGNQAEINSALENLVANTALRARYAAQTVQAVTTKFSPENTVLRLVPVFQRTIQNPSGSF
jgi:glycosyltransferase involved in cell wall biosynthesis